MYLPQKQPQKYTIIFDYTTFYNKIRKNSHQPPTPHQPLSDLSVIIISKIFGYLFYCYCFADFFSGFF